MWVGGKGEGRVMGIAGTRRRMVGMGGGRGDYVIDSQGAQNFGHCDLSNAVPTKMNSGLWL